jgi:uncharacterized membrane protein YcaP (DUF421 family)
MHIDWGNIFIRDLNWTVAFVIIVRTVVMFTATLVMLRLSGKKGVRQLSIFEVAIIIGLGSAAGDPMLNEDSAIFPALVVFVTILLFYRLLTQLASKYQLFESVLEGDPIYVIEDGQFILGKQKKHSFAKDELLAEMRQKSIEHIGQVRIAIMETNGMVSFFYYDDENVKLGLPVLPKLYNQKSKQIDTPGDYACANCAYVENIKAPTICKRCNKEEWVLAIKTTRIS